jgi:hypothetical protein
MAFVLHSLYFQTALYNVSSSPELKIAHMGKDLTPL